MTKAAIEMLDIRTRQRWREWLELHHASTRAAWLVFHKVHTGVASLGYDDAVEEALCFGWIDSIVKRLDADRYARKFTPRQPESRWSTPNRRRYADLSARGLLAPAGRRRPPTGRSGDASRPAAVPPYIVRALRADRAALSAFERLAPSRRRAYVGWVDSAKRDDTRQRRLREMLRVLAAGRPLGLK